MESAAVPRVVIVGGGFGGLHAARALAKAPVKVTLVDRNNYHLFQPLLYQVATSALSPGDIAYPIRSVLRKQRNTGVILAEVVGVDPAGRRVILADGEIPYDRLILASGARHAYFGHDAWEPLAPGLKTLEDALEIRRRILLAFEEAERAADESLRRALLTFVVVGGGPTGVELAGALAEIARQTMSGEFRAFDPAAARIVLVEGAPRVLPLYPPALSASATAQLTRMGVEVRASTMVEEIVPGRGVRIRAVASGSPPGRPHVEDVHAEKPGDAAPAEEGRGSAWITTRTILWAAGVAASPLARSLGAPLDRAGRILVNPDLTVPGHPEILAIGDCASLPGPDGNPLPGVAPVAIQQGGAAAANVLRSLRGEPSRPFRYRDKGNLATIGRAAAVADFGAVRLSGFLAWLVWSLVHIANLIGFRNRVLVMLQWAWAWFTRRRGVRLITWHEPHRPDAPASERNRADRMRPGPP